MDIKSIVGLNDFCIIEPINETETTSLSGIVFSQENVPAKKAIKYGKLVAAGPKTGFADVDLGNTVFFVEDKSFKVFIGGDEYVVVKEEDLVAWSSKA